jgi:hypothetical protein
MSLNIKKAGAYSAAAGIFVKKSGVYSAVQAMFVKVAGVYQNVLSATFSPQSIMIEFDNFATRGALVGGVDSGLGAMSIWVDHTALIVGVVNTIVGNGSVRVNVLKDVGERIRVQVTNGSSNFRFRTISTVTAEQPITHIAASWSTNFAAGSRVYQLYRDGVHDGEIFDDTGAAFTLPYSSVDWSIGATVSGGNVSKIILSEFMLWAGQYIDWSTNIGKVYSGGLPVNPGDTGSLVNGSVPAIYLSLRGASPASTFLANRGSGGDFTQVAGTATLRADTALVVYGDSLVFGTGSTVYPKDTFVYKVARGLNTKYRTLNYGVGGTSTDQILAIMTAGGFGQPAAAVPVALTKSRIWILDGGYNSVAGGPSAIVPKVQSMVSTMLDLDPSAKWIFIGIPNSNTNGISSGAPYTTITTANSQLATLYGANFLDILPWMIANGLAAAGLGAPDANDAADIADGIIPRRLRSADLSVHWSDAGQTAVAVAVRDRLQALGYD